MWFTYRPKSNLKVTSLWNNREWTFTNRRTCSVDHETQGGGDFGGGDSCRFWIWSRQKQPMRKVFTGTLQIWWIFPKQIQVASPHWGWRIVWHLTLADAVNSLQRISCSNKMLGNYWEPSTDASGGTELAVEPSGIVLGLIQQIIFFQTLVLDEADDKAAVTEPNSTVFTQTFWPCLQLISKDKSAPDVCLLWYRPSVLCTWELPIWSTRSMKTKPRTRDTPMQAWSCSWLCSCFPPAPRADSTSPLVSDTSTTPAWPWLWCPPAGTRVRREKKEAVQNYVITCLLTLLSSITDPGGISWEAADIQMNTKQILLFDKVGYARQTDVTWLFAASWTLLCLKRFQTVTVNTGRHIHTYSMSICSICSILRSLTLKTDHYKHRAQQDNNHKLMLKPALTQHCCTSWTGQQGSKLLCRLSKLKSWHQHWSNI